MMKRSFHGSSEVPSIVSKELRATIKPEIFPLPEASIPSF